MEATNEQLLLRPAEAARALGCSTRDVYDLVYSGALPHLRLGGTSLRIPKVAITRMIDAALQEPEVAAPKTGIRQRTAQLVRQAR